MNKKTTAWEMNVDQAEMFFQLAHSLNLNTEHERLALLDYMKDTGNIKRVYTTGRDKEQVVKDLAKHYKIMRVKAK